MTHYAILHKPSGKFFPTFRGGQCRGSTYIDLPFEGMPRIFNTLTAAKNTLRWWLAGEAVPEYDVEDEWGGGRSQVGASPGKGKPNRIASDMEIVQVELKIIGQQELPL